MTSKYGDRKYMSDSESPPHRHLHSRDNVVHESRFRSPKSVASLTSSPWQHGTTGKTTSFDEGFNPKHAEKLNRVSRRDDSSYNRPRSRSSPRRPKKSSERSAYKQGTYDRDNSSVYSDSYKRHQIYSPEKPKRRDRTRHALPGRLREEMFKPQTPNNHVHERASDDFPRRTRSEDIESTSRTQLKWLHQEKYEYEDNTTDDEEEQHHGRYHRQLRSSRPPRTLSPPSSGSSSNNQEATKTNLEMNNELQDLANDLRKILYNEKLSDIFLRGTDGGTIPAVSAILFARSPSFRRCMNEINTTEERVLSFKYSSSVLGAIVEYCYTGSVDVTCYPDDEITARMYVGVYDAADYFELPELRETMLHLNYNLLMKWRPLACTIYDESMLFGESARDLAFVSRKIICMNPAVVMIIPEEDEIRGGGVLSFSTPSFSKIITSQELKGEWTKFQCLKIWTDNSPDEDSAIDRRAVAQKLSTNIQLSRIQPSDLNGVVASSGLVSPEQLVDAYKHQAFLAERDGDIRDFFQHEVPVHARGGIMVVRGAGVKETNGVYISNANKDLLMYSKKSIYRNKEVTFYIYRSRPFWYLGLTKRQVPIHFYKASIQQENGNLPPTEGWKVVDNDEKVESHGVGPAPSMLWISESSNLDDYGLNNMVHI